MEFASEDRAEIAAALTELTTASRNEPGCVSYVPCAVAGEGGQLLIWEQYKDQAAVEAHRASAHFKKYAVGVLYQKMRKRTLEDLNAIA